MTDIKTETQTFKDINFKCLDPCLTYSKVIDVAKIESTDQNAIVYMYGLMPALGGNLDFTLMANNYTYITGKAKVSFEVSAPLGATGMIIAGLITPDCKNENVLKILKQTNGIIINLASSRLAGEIIFDYDRGKKANMTKTKQMFVICNLTKITTKMKTDEIPIVITHGPIVDTIKLFGYTNFNCRELTA